MQVKINFPDWNKINNEVKWVAVGSIGTVIAAIATVAGLFYSRSSSPGPVPTPTSSIAEPTITPTTPPPVPSPTPSPTTSSGVAIRNHGLLNVANSYSDTYDLDSTNSSWGEGSSIVFHSEFQAYGGSSILLTYFANYKIVSKSSSILFSTCEGTGYGGAGSVIQYSDLQQGEKLCFKTSEGRLSLLVVKSVSANSLTFDVTTWQPTGQ